MSSINSECVVLLMIKCYCNLTSLKIVVHNYIFSKIIKQTEEVHQNNINVTTAVKNIFGFWVFLQCQSKSVGLAPSWQTILGNRSLLQWVQSVFLFFKVRCF